MNLTKNFASRRQSWRDSRQDRAEIFATVNLLLGENLGEIRGSIPARFWPPGLLLPGENLGEIRGRIPARFWPPGISFPGEIPAGKKNPGGQNLAGIPTRFPPRSRRDPAKIPVLILQGCTNSVCSLKCQLFPVLSLVHVSFLGIRLSAGDN